MPRGRRRDGQRRVGTTRPEPAIAPLPDGSPAPGARRRVGRPSELTPELQEQMVAIVSGGNYLETACNVVGIASSTVRKWVARGARELARVEKDPRRSIRAEEAPYVEFRTALKRAMSVAEARDVGLIERVAQGQPRRTVTTRRVLPDGSVEETTEVIEGMTPQWTAAAWRLERKHRKRWGRFNRTEITGKDGRDLVGIDALRSLFDDDPDEEEGNADGESE